jgi:LmbE family N-acetylglucosaminyl deacetylase
LTDRLASLIPNNASTVTYAPLGVGNHIDHQIIHSVARQLLAQGYHLAFYEEYPYAQHPNKLEAALAAAGAEQYRAETIPLDTEDVMAKTAALAYYRTQLKVLFGGAEAMRNLVWAFAATCSPDEGLAERIWWPQEI